MWSSHLARDKSVIFGTSRSVELSARSLVLGVKKKRRRAVACLNLTLLSQALKVQERAPPRGGPNVPRIVQVGT